MRRRESREALERSGAVAELLFGNAHAVQQRDIEVAERGLLRRTQPAAGAQASLPLAREQQRQIRDRVAIAILERAAVHDHRVVEQRRAALVETLDALQEVGELLHI